MGGRHKGKGDVCTHIAASCCCKAETDQHCKAIMCCVLCLVTQSYLTLWDPMDDCLPGSSVHGDSPGKNTGVGCHALLQRIFPTQGSNPGLPHCKKILYHLSQLYSKLKKKKIKTYIPGKKLWFHSFNQPAFIMQLLYTLHCQGNMRDSKEVPPEFSFFIHLSAHSFRDGAEHLLTPSTALDTERQQTDKSPT